jgi:hypothetical protein
MSEYKKMATSFLESEEDCLIDALVDIGFPRKVIEVHAEAEHLRGYEGDRRAQTAHIIIRRENVGSGSNDLGFEKMADGTYELRVSEYDRNSLQPDRSKIGMRYDHVFLKKLSGLHGLRVSTKTMVKKGYRLAQPVIAMGSKRRMVWVKS